MRINRQGASEPREPLLRRVMPELDSIRGAAIIGVVVYHGYYWSVDPNTFPYWQRLFLTATWAGRLGVNLFFVLSGFLITGLLIDSRSKSDYFRYFYKRRALRILPVYLALIAVLYFLHYPPVFLLLSLLYLSNLTPLFGVAIAYPVLWSLAVEEHFYLVWPAIVRKLSLRALLWVSIGIIAVSPLLRFLGFPYAHSFEFNEYTWNSADGLACGALLAILIRQWREDRTHVFRLTCATAIVALLLGPLGIVTRTRRIGAAMQVVPWQFLFVAVLGSCLLIGTTEWKWLAQLPLLRFFGKISYGLYLIHLLVFEGYDHFISWQGFSGLTVRFLCVSAISTALAWLSREYFEEHFLRLGKRPAPSEKATPATS